MAEIRVGDWVEMISPTEVCGPVESVGPGHSVTIRARDGKPLTSARSDFQHRAPDPLPERLPIGVTWNELTKPRAETAPVLQQGWYQAKWSGDSNAYSVAAEDIDWTSYHAALHREQDEAQMKRQPIKLSDPDAFERTRAAMGTYVPEVGARVLVGIPEAPKRHNTVAQVVRVIRAPNEGGLGRFRLWFADGNELEFICRVSPLLASPIDVECPHAATQHPSAPRLCEGSAGRGCTNLHSGAPYPRGEYHADRSAHFLALTGGKDSRPASASAVDGPRSVGSERGDSGTGRAAGELASGRLVKKPAAPSGFKPPRDVYDVACEACGEPVRVPGQCFPCIEVRDGKRVQVAPHALRTAAFEARRLGQWPPCSICGIRARDWREHCPACEIYLNNKRDELPRCTECLQLASETATTVFGTPTCGDCASDDAWVRAQHGHAWPTLDERIRKARADLDRPLPKPDALRTWPERAGEDYEL